MSSAITLITPTGNRPEAFALCEQWVKRQTYSGQIQWIVVDDGPEPVKCTCDQVHIRPTPLWKPGNSTTQARNLQIALEWIRADSECVVFIEDDDWYRSDYLARTIQRLQESQSDLTGLCCTRYYHLGSGLYRINENIRHASLCETAFRRSVIPLFKEICARYWQYLDYELFKAATGQFQINLFPNDGSVLGIKGMPGRSGIGIGHDPTRSSGWVPDLGFRQLRTWIGNDIQHYRPYLNGPF